MSTSAKIADSKYWAGILDNHRKVLVNFLETRTKFSKKTKNTLLSLYDGTMDKDNIKYFYARTMEVFVPNLMRGTLHQIANYEPYTGEGSLG